MNTIKKVFIAASLLLLSSCEFRADMWNEINRNLDNTQPSITGTAGLNLSEYSPSAIIIFYADESLNPDTISKSTVTLWNETDGVAESTYNVYYLSAYKQIEVQGNYFSRGDTYSLTVNTDVTDPAGNHLTAEYTTVTFTIQAAPSITSIISYPTYNAADKIQKTDDGVVITFSEPVKLTQLASAATLTESVFLTYLGLVITSGLGTSDVSAFTCEYGGVLSSAYYIRRNDSDLVIGDTLNFTIANPENYFEGYDGASCTSGSKSTTFTVN